MQVAQTYDKFEQCLECLGTGKIEKLICTKPVSECCGGCYTYKKCENCNGTGEVNSDDDVGECEHCNGTGEEPGSND